MKVGEHGGVTGDWYCKNIIKIIINVLNGKSIAISFEIIYRINDLEAMVFLKRKFT